MQTQDLIKVKPVLRGQFHQAMFFVSLGACGVLLSLCKNNLELISILVYSLGALIMFGISALYHRITWTPKQRQIMKRFDHAGIYIMIAGTITPVSALALSVEAGKKLLILIWIVALLGFLQSLFFVNIPKMLSSLIYILMSFLILPYIKMLMLNLGAISMTYLISGGVVYIIGAMAYGLKRPVFKPAIFGYHEFFHLMVCLGAILHFLMVFTILRGQVR